MAERLLLAGLMAGGLAWGNDTVALAAALALMLREVAPHPLLQAAVRHSVDLGILFLVLGLLLPVATGNIPVPQLFGRLVTTRLGWVSLLVGLASTRLASDGFHLMQHRPEALLGLVTGSLAGVALLGGIPAGPLVAAGLVAWLARLLP